MSTLAPISDPLEARVEPGDLGPDQVETEPDRERIWPDGSRRRSDPRP